MNGSSTEGAGQGALYKTQCYYQRCDDLQESWDMAAAAQDGALTYALVHEIADSGRWPEWNSDAELRMVRERSNRLRN